VGWSLKKVSQLIRRAAGEETRDEKMAAHRPTEVQLFGIGIFNTKDALSDRLWNMAASQGDTITAWPLKFLAWVAKKWERDEIAPLPPQPLTTSSRHVLLNNTQYHDKYHAGEVDRRRANALETIHDYIAKKLNPGYDSDRWDRLREPWEGAVQGGDAGPGPEEFREMKIRSPEEFTEMMFKNMRRHVIEPLLKVGPVTVPSPPHPHG